MLKSDGQSLTLESVKGKLGDGDATANLDVRQDPNGIALNARVELSDAVVLDEG